MAVGTEMVEGALLVGGVAEIWVEDETKGGVLSKAISEVRSMTTWADFGFAFFARCFLREDLVPLVDQPCPLKVRRRRTDFVMRVGDW